MRIVIGGSYHKFLNDINQLHDKLEKSRHTVLAPLKDAAKSKVDSKYNYVLFQGEEEENPFDVQQRFMDKIHSADAFVVCNKNGYMGDTVALELGWAFAAIRDEQKSLKQIYLTDHVTLLDTIKRKGRITLQDVENDPQFQFYRKYYGSNEMPEDYLEWIAIHVQGYEAMGALTVGIDTLIDKEINREDEEER